MKYDFQKVEAPVRAAKGYDGIHLGVGAVTFSTAFSKRLKQSMATHVDFQIDVRNSAILVIPRRSEQRAAYTLNYKAHGSNAVSASASGTVVSKRMPNGRYIFVEEADGGYVVMKA